MAKINARAKGAAGEREFCDWLQKAFDLPRKPERNLDQVRSGGVDVIFQPFAFEVKRRQTLNYSAWWLQVKKGVEDKDGPAFGLEPVVAFRQNNKEWEFLISARHIGVKNGFIHLGSSTFKKWVYEFLERQEKQNHVLRVISNDNGEKRISSE